MPQEALDEKNMAGLEVLGAVASTAQLLDLGIRASQGIIRLYDTLKTGPTRIESRLQTITGLQRFLTELRSEKDFLTAELEVSVKHILEKLQKLQTILEKLQKHHSRPGGRYRVLLLISVNEHDIQEIFQDLERNKTTLMLQFISNYHPRRIHKSSTMPLATGEAETNAEILEDGARRTFSNLPTTLVSRFVGQRTHLSQMDLALHSTKAEERVVVLTGTAGSGKSQLAMKFCQNQRDYGLSVYWIDSSSGEQLKRSFWSVATAIHAQGICKKACTDSENAIVYLKECLSMAELPWIIVFDNWDDPEAVPYLPDVLPDSRSGLVVIISRHPDAARLGLEIKLNDMTDQDALELLVTRIGVDLDPKVKMAGLAIVRKLGNLPLAIDQAASYIGHLGLPIQDFIQQYETQMQQILTYLPAVWEYRKSVPGEERLDPASVFTTWELTFTSMTKKDHIAAQLMSFLGFFKESAITETLFSNFLKSCMEISHPTEPRPGKETLLDILRYFQQSDGSWNSQKFRKALSSLSNARLIEIISSSSTNDIKISLHPLVSDWIKIREGKLKSSDVFIQTCGVVESLIRAKRSDSDYSFESWQELLAHVDGLLRHWDTFAASTNKSLRTSLDAFCKLYFRRGDYTTAVEVNKKLIMLLDCAGEHNSPQKYEALGRLARSHHCLSQYPEAEKAACEAVAGYKNTIGDNAIPTAAAKEVLANLYRSRAKHDQAAHLYLEVIECRRAALDETNEKTMCARANLANVYMSQKKFDQSKTIHDDLATQLWIGGKPFDVDLIWIKNDYATLLQKIGRADEAEEIHREVLATRQKYLGPHHHDTLWTMADLAQALRSQHKNEEAKEVFEAAVDQLKKRLGEDHSETLWAASGLGNLYREMGDLDRAERLLSWVLHRQKQLLGNQHLRVLRAIDDLSNVYRLRAKLNHPESFSRMTIGPLSDDQQTKRPARRRTIKTTVLIAMDEFITGLAFMCRLTHGRRKQPLPEDEN